MHIEDYEKNVRMCMKLRWAHVSECTFSYVVAHLLIIIFYTYIVLINIYVNNSILCYIVESTSMNFVLT